MKKAIAFVFVALLSSSLFAASAPSPARIVLISGEYEYFSSNSLPAFKQFLETNYHFDCTFLQRTEGNDIPGLEALERADLAIVFIRRMTLPEDQLARVKKYLASGKPLIGLRTASHAFENWKEWDHEVLGGNYHMHHGNALVATAHVNKEHAAHPILKGVSPEFLTAGSLYKTTPLAPNSTLLLTGTVEGQEPEPVAWTHEYQGARIFYTSLGHPKDFENANFHKLLVNAIFWCLGKNPPGSAAARKINAEEVEKLLAGKQAVILDVRRPAEFASGHIPGAVNLNVEDPAFDENARKLDTNQTYVVHCAHGIRSARAADKLKALNFGSILDFSEGFSAWQKAEKPVAK
jgi:rhodanese-related sulfurtransferase